MIDLKTLLSNTNVHDLLVPKLFYLRFVCGQINLVHGVKENIFGVTEVLGVTENLKPYTVILE